MTPMRPSLALIAMLGAAALSGCTPFPDIGDDTSKVALAQPYPDLVPLGGLNARLETGRIQPGTAPALEARVAGLRNRAERLRGDVVDPATRSRMRAGIEQ